MRAVLQRVAQAEVRVNGERVASIGRGYLVLVGVTHTDGEPDARYIADKIASLRLFEDEAGKINLGITDVGGEVLLVSQFTLYADCRKGRRPSFTDAAPPDMAEQLYLRVAELLREAGLPVQTGVFGAHMQVALVNDGPVTILLDSHKIL
ncbi:MAG: D-aminoacyl-tRNA deacylase [Armatimonadota bacterium]|nr:D-aminoacyl-tRNA deacylase [bacterium]MCS7309597.1 D-aminoacyl-tRNA deacylase [Armatimonadota bacterium]MDW8104217.1 D-aminoacyl-tRNA deacylase [Armatimonadota bacterium]MDW8290129.1 D-aminoacyl-tRNA deacylase [Armatimonadota bacterium]